MIRAHFENKLKQLHSEIIDMGRYVESAINNSIKAFKENDLALCRTIIDGDVAVDDMEKKIESDCLWLIAREQPIASDLRKITTALKIITDMERIGDHASDIAEIVLRIADKNIFSDSIHVGQMAAAAIGMVHDALNAYVNYDIALANAMEERDDIVDEFFNTIKRELADVFRTQPDHMDNAIDYLLIAKYLERIGDHAVNICEWVKFSQTGEHKKTQVF